MLDAKEEGAVTPTILGWCPGEPSGLELLYRASRDGLTGRAFRTKIGCSASTITLVRTKKASGSGTRGGVVGGFSNVPWNEIPFTTCVDSPGAFLFMLWDGESGGGGGGGAEEAFQPVKRGVKPGAAPKVCCCEHIVFGFSDGSGEDDLVVRDGSRTLETGNNTYGIPAGTPFLALNGNAVVELEVFRVCYDDATTTAPLPPPAKPPLPTPPPKQVAGKGLIDCTATVEAGPLSLKKQHEEDVHRFGTSIAEFLKQERSLFRHAQTELAQANAQAVASVQALAAVYGPDIAQGREDPVIELVIRGERSTATLTTLLATIRTCPPESLLAVRFERWSETDAERDVHGPRQIDGCSPHIFAKLLDVLRMKKRVGWGGCGGGGGASIRPVRVAAKASDRTSFEELVSVYFYVCEGFVLGSVQFL